MRSGGVARSAVAVFLTCVGLNNHAAAEAGPPPPPDDTFVPSDCTSVRAIEAFAGAPDCPNVGYAVIESSDSDGYVDLSYGGDYETVYVANPGLILIGTANVEVYFGVEPDIVVDSPFPLRPEGGTIAGCSDWSYGSARVPVNACEGQAIRWSSSSNATLAEPAPVNSRGEVGTLMGCGPSVVMSDTRDAGGLDASVGAPPLCEQFSPDGSSSTPGGPSDPLPPGVDTSEPAGGDVMVDETTSDVVGAPTDDGTFRPPVGAATDETTTDDATDTDAPAGGSSGQDTARTIDEGAVVRGVDDEPKSSCACSTVGRAGAFSLSFLATLVAISCTVARRRHARRD